MGRYGNTNISLGTNGNPQVSLEQGNLKSIVNQISSEDLIKDLEKNNIKFNKNDIIFIIKDENNKTVWLEKGNEMVGLKHIEMHHENDFKNAFGKSKSEIPQLIKEVITEGIVTKEIKETMPNGIKRISKWYKYNNKYHIITAFGDNGFIITAIPTSKEKEV